MVHLKIFFGTQFFQLLIESIVVFIPVMTGIIINKAFIIMILLSSIWFNIGRFINNSMFLWYITDDSISFTIFNCLYINPRMLICTNIKNHQCNYTCYKTNNLGARKWIFLMPQITITISDVFAFTEKIIIIKWTILVIKVSVASPKKS